MTSAPKAAPSYLIRRKPAPRTSMSGPAEHTTETPQQDASTRQDSTTDHYHSDHLQDVESAPDSHRDYSTVSNRPEISAGNNRRGSCIHENFPAAFDTGANGSRHVRCQSCYDSKPDVERAPTSHHTGVLRSKSTGSRYMQNEIDPQRADNVDNDGDPPTRQPTSKSNGDARSTADTGQNVSRRHSLAVRQARSMGNESHSGEQTERPYSEREIKTLKEDIRADEELLKAKKRELECLLTILRQAEKDEAAALSAHRAAQRAEHEQGLAFVAAKAKHESTVEDLLSKEAKLTTCRRKSNQHLEFAKEKEQEIEELTQRKATDDRERKTILREERKKKRGWR